MWEFSTNLTHALWVVKIALQPVDKAPRVPRTSTDGLIVDFHAKLTRGLVGHFCVEINSLCLVDGADAALRSGGEIIQFMLRSNLLAWARFGTLALKELKAWYGEGTLDDEAVDAYLDAEYRRLLSM